MENYERFSVERDVTEFCGWQTLLDLMKEAENTPYYSKPLKRLGLDDDPEWREKMRRHLILRDQGLVAWSFECGGRINETLQLTKSMITVTLESVEVFKMPLLKRYDKVDEDVEVWEKEGKPPEYERKLWHFSPKRDAWIKRKYITKSKFMTRSRIAFPKFEPLIPYALQWLDECEGEKLFTISSVRAYQIVRDLGERFGLHKYDKNGNVINMHVTPHRFRSERACQLASEYSFREKESKEFFSWEEPKTIDRYTKLAPGAYLPLMRKDRIGIYKSQ